MSAPGETRLRRRKWITVAALGGILAVMLTLVSYSVPLYRLFCAATGFGGATQRAIAAPEAVSGRVVTVRFATDVAPGLPWRFVPEQAEVKVRLGEEKLVFFSARNLSDKPLIGHATFNVTPTKAGIYFNKIQCFCFSDERLGAGDRADMPVDFYVDPKLGSDPETREVDTITLSYTFFRSADPEGVKDLSRFVASAKPDPQRGANLFAQRCAACHALDRNKIGPMLGDIVGRRAGTAAGYDYSPALRAAAIRWSPETLNRWLAGPQQFLPGARMPVSEPDATIRRDIIAYLEAPDPPARAAAIQPASR